MIYIYFNLFFIIFFAITLIVSGIFIKSNMIKFLNKIYDKISFIIKKFYKLIIFLIIAIALFTSIYKITTVPYGMHVDEAGMAYDALSIANYGMDRYLNKFPVYLINYGGGQSAMYAYITALLIKIFTLNKFIIRLPAVIFRILIIIFGFLLIKKEENKKQNLIFIFLLSITPYFIMQSRWGLDCNLLIGFLTIAIFNLVHAIKEYSNKFFVISGIFFGLALYTYALSYIIIPILLFLTIIYLIITDNITFGQILLLGIPIALLATPLILMILLNNGIIENIETKFITIPILPGYRGSELSFSNIKNNLYIFTSLLSFDSSKIFNRTLIYNAIPYFGTIYYFSIPFFIIGFIVGLKKVYLSLKNREFDISVIFLIWFISTIICQLLIAEPNINKANAIFVPIIYFTTAGIMKVTEKLKFLILLIVIFLAINLGMFCNYYFNQYNLDNMEQNLFATYF